MAISVQQEGENAFFVIQDGANTTTFKTGVTGMDQFINCLERLDTGSLESLQQIVALLDLCKSALRKMRHCREMRILESTSFYEEISYC